MVDNEARFRLCLLCLEEEKCADRSQTWPDDLARGIVSLTEKAIHYIEPACEEGLIWFNPWRGSNGQGLSRKLCHNCRYALEHVVLGGEILDVP